MKAKLHSKIKEVRIVLTDGSTYLIPFKRVLSSKELQWALSLDTQSHPFWQRKSDWNQNLLDISSQRTRFQKKYNYINPNTLK